MYLKVLLIEDLLNYKGYVALLLFQGDRGLTGEKGVKGAKGDLGDSGLPGEAVSKIAFIIPLLKDI